MTDVKHIVIPAKAGINVDSRLRGNDKGFINVKGIITLLVILVVIDLAVAFVLAPFLSKTVQAVVNQNTQAKIVIGTVRLHPLLLSAGISSVDVYDAEDASKRIFHGGPFNARLSVGALLRKRIAFAEIRVERAELEVVRDASGGLNIEKIGKQDKRSAIDTLKAMADKRDWFRKAYEGAKKAHKRKQEKKKQQSVWKTRARELPRGYVVDFKTAEDPLLEAASLELKNTVVVFEDPKGKMPPFRNVEIIAKDLLVQTPSDISWKLLKISGDFEAARKGSFKLRMEEKADAHEFEAKLKDLDLAPLAPLYERSLPVTFTRGFLTLESDSVMKTESLLSKNRLKLEEAQMAAKTKWGFLGAADEAVLQALNSRASFDIQFEITGTPDKPSFSGFQTALMDLVKEDLKQLGAKGIQEKAKGALEKFKNLF